MSQTLKSPPKVKLTAHYLPHGKNPRLVEFHGYFGCRRVHTQEIDPTWPKARRAFINAFVQKWAPYANALETALPEATHADLDQQLQDLARQTLPPEILARPARDGMPEWLNL